MGAAAARMAQSVASRRVSALERHLGERLLERSSRPATLTPFGRDMLPLARGLVDLADRLEDEAEAARHRPLRLAVPATCSTGVLARLIAEAYGQGIRLDPRPAAPAERADLVRSRQVRAALLALPPAEGAWTVPLGLAVAGDSRAEAGGGALYLDTLRPSRTDREQRPRRVLLQAEDDVPHVRDRLARLRDAVGLRPAQLVVVADLAAAVGEVLSRGDALVCSPAQARDLRLHWRPVGELAAGLARGYALVAADETDADATRVREQCANAIARCLGAGAGSDADIEVVP